MLSSGVDRENYEVDYLGKVIGIDFENKFIMDLIRKNLDLLLKHSDYEYNENSEILEILNDEPLGFIMINYDEDRQKYFIQGIIVYDHGKLVGTRIIHLLYGECVKLRDNLILKLVSFLREDVGPKLIISVKCNNIEDRYLYKEAGFKFNGTSLASDGKLLAIFFMYKF